MSAANCLSACLRHHSKYSASLSTWSASLTLDGCARSLEPSLVKPELLSQLRDHRVRVGIDAYCAKACAIRMLRHHRKVADAVDAGSEPVVVVGEPVALVRR